MNKSTDRLSIDLDGIGHALSDKKKKLSVPINQRSYAWEEKHVNDLLTDLFDSIRKSEEEYFIGSIVISSSGGKNEVVDGQQRLATISILIAAIRDYFLQNGNEKKANSLQDQYLSSEDRRTEEIIPNLTLNSNDHNFFYSHVILPPGSSGHNIKASRESHERIKKAYQLAKKNIQTYVALTNDPVSPLLDLLDFIDESLKIIWVQVPDHANAYTIFETLNDRGLDLAISDLLKNFLFGQSDNRIQEVQAGWTEMYSLLESTENEELVISFIRHHWSSIYGLTRRRELYNKIKEKITSKQRAVDLTDNLAKSSKIYVALIDTTHSFWSEYSEEAKNHMATLNMFGMVQVRPLLLAVISKFQKKEIEKALKFLVSASVRFLIHGGLGGGALETQYSERAKEINQGEISSTKGLVERMKKAIPSDSEFEESFKIASVSKHYLGRYYLMALENCKKGKEKPELIPNADTSAVNLEHVLPKNPDPEWNFDEETHHLLYNRIGNLAIISTKINSTIANSVFDKKKYHYLSSEFELTKEISHYEKWTPDEINERQNMLAQLAVKAWPIKPR
ncbi:MAG: DUF262 domain-containing HNH endonuclease family protein [Cyclobacteriaceae bacterium]